MGVGTTDIFGDAENAVPATPGSYGEAPPGFRLPDATRLGPVRLQIADLGRSLSFYQDVLGLRLLEQTSSGARLGGQDGRPLVELREQRGARPAPHRGALGLFHFAILLPDRAALGRFVRHLDDVSAKAGAGDHLVSEAMYLQDPDNLGIEVYYDRPRASWRRIGRELVMATDPVDIAGLLQAAGGERWSGMPGGTVMGHVHLHVGDIARGAAFYSNALGFDRTVWHYPGALFLSAGGYHHHLGTNIWAGPGATSPREEDARLLEWTIELPDAPSVAAAAASLVRNDYALAEGAGSADQSYLVVQDPWGTAVRLRVAPTSER